MVTTLQQANKRNLNTILRVGDSKRIVRLNAAYALLPGLLIIPALSGVVLIA